MNKNFKLLYDEVNKCLVVYIGKVLSDDHKEYYRLFDGFCFYEVRWKELYNNYKIINFKELYLNEK